MEFKSQICTTREQSEKLLALGLKKETADMVYDYAVLGIYLEPKIVDWREFNFEERDIPAWSLHRLLLLLNCSYVELDINNPFEDCITRIEFMIKESKIFNKDYLEEKKWQ